MSKLVAFVQATSSTLKTMQAQLQPPPVEDVTPTEAPPGPSRISPDDSAFSSTEMTVETDIPPSAADREPFQQSPNTHSNTPIATATSVDAIATTMTAATCGNEAETQPCIQSDRSPRDSADSIRDARSEPAVTPSPSPTSSSWSAKSPAAIHASPPTPIVLPSPADIAALEHQLSVSGSNLREAFDRLSRSRVEEDSCSKKAHLEESRMEETIEWMLAMQGVLWPENVPDRELGRPILPEQASHSGRGRSKKKVKGAGSSDPDLVSGPHSGEILMAHEESEIEDIAEKKATAQKAQESGPPMFVFFAPIPTPQPLKAPSTSSKSKDLLSYGMRNALDAARMLGILEVVDVDTTMEAFRWMAWCFRCLHVLRIPPATYTLKRLINCCRPLKLADERVVRAIGGILSRSQAWKNKARKLVFGGQSPPIHLPSSVTKKLDTGKLHALIAEGAMVPVTSALKEHLVRTWDQMLQTATTASSTLPSSALPSEQADTPSTAAGGKPKRVSKAAASPAVPGIAAFTVTTMTSEVINSSDEEEGDEEENDGEEVGISSGSSVAQDRAPSSLPSLSSQSDATTTLSTGLREKRQRDGGEWCRDCVHTTLSPSMWASLPTLWPPSITVRQVLTVPKRLGPLTALANRNSNASNNNSKKNYATSDARSSSNSSNSSNCSSSGTVGGSAPGSSSNNNNNDYTGVNKAISSSSGSKDGDSSLRNSQDARDDNNLSKIRLAHDSTEIRGDSSGNNINNTNHDPFAILSQPSLPSQSSTPS